MASPVAVTALWGHASFGPSGVRRWVDCWVRELDWQHPSSTGTAGRSSLSRALARSSSLDYSLDVRPNNVNEPALLLCRRVHCEVHEILKRAAAAII